MKTIFKAAAALMAALIVSIVVADTADAGGRKGSHRYGGVNSHGKYSHYR
jgi:hypothetical protein